MKALFFERSVFGMNKVSEIKKYKNDEFKINCIYNEKGKNIFRVIEEAFKNYYDLKANT